MKKWLRVTALSCVFCLMFGQSVFASQAEIDELQQKKDEAQAEVDSLQTELMELMGKIDELEKDVIAKGDEVAKAQSDLTAAQANEAEQYKAMKLRIKYMYEEGDTSMITVLMTSDNLADVMNRTEYFSALSEYDRAMLLEYIKIKEEVAALKAKLESQLAELETAKKDLEDEQKALNDLIAQKKEEVENFDEQLQDAVAAYQQAQLAALQAAMASRGGAAAASSSSAYQAAVAAVQSGGYSTADFNAIIQAAYSQLGVSYGWGTAIPGVSFDCSGLVNWAYAQAGISVPRSSADFIATGTITDNPQPGDVIWRPGHVGIYLGGGQMIDAYDEGASVQISTVKPDDTYLTYR